MVRMASYGRRVVVMVTVTFEIAFGRKPIVEIQYGVIGLGVESSLAESVC